MSAERKKVADVADLQGEHARVIREVDGIEIAVFAIDGEYHALANFCPHQAGPLCEGPVRGDLRGAPDGWRLSYDASRHVIACPWHGWRFDVETGDSLETGRYSVPKYDVEVEDGEVFVVR